MNSTTASKTLLHQALIDWMYERVDPQCGHPWEHRPWRDAGKNAWSVDAPMRPVRDDGVRPPYLNYGTAKPV